MTQPKKQILIQLQTLIKNLLDILERDSHCPWSSHFRSCHKTASHLLSQGFSQDDLKDLSRAIHSVYRGASSFSDYSPTIYHSSTNSFELIQGAEDFSHLSQTIFHLALNLRQKDPQ